MPNSEDKKKPIGQDKSTQKRKRKPEYTRVNAAGVEAVKGSERTQEEKYRMLVQNLPCAVYSAYPGKAGPTTFMSNKWKDWTGYSPEELYHDPEAWPRCIHCDDREDAVNTYIEACRDKKAYNLEYRIIHKDTGQLRYVRDQGHLSEDEQGAVVRVDGIVTDITELKKANNELDKYRNHLEELVKKRTAELTSAYETLKVENKERERAEQTLRKVEKEKTTVLENLSDLIVYRDVDMVTLWASKSMANWHGMSEEQIVGRICYRSRYGRAEPCEDCHVVEAMQSGQRQELEKELPDERCWHVTVNPVLSDSGQVIGTIEVSQDITERKQSEQALRKTTDLLETIFEHTYMLVACLDPQFNFVRVNRAYAEADERQPSFFHGKNHFVLYPNEENEVIFRRVVETGIPYFAYSRPFEYAEHPEWGLSYWDWGLVPIKNQQGIVSGLVLTLTDVTARKRAEEALKASEEKLNAMLQSISDHMSMMDKDLNILWANDVAKTRFGDDIIGKKCYEVYHGRQSPCEPYPCLTLRAFQDGGVHEHDIEITDKDGNTAWFHCVANVALRDNVGKAIAVLEVSTDITERRQAEEALRISSDIVRSIPSGLFTYKYEPPDKLFFLDGNPAAERLANIKVSECIGKEFNDIWPQARDSGITDNYLKVMKTGKTFETEDQYYEDDKLEGIFRICVFQMSKELLGVAFENITQQKLAEEALTESESRFRELVENMREVFWMENADGTELLYISPMYEQVWGRSCQSFYENPGDWVESIHPEDRQRVAEAFSQLRETGEYSQEFRIVRPDGTIRWIWDRGVLIRNEFDEVIRVAGVAEDVTECKRTEEALRESEEKFRSLAEQSPNMIFINKKGKIVYANKKSEEVMGYKREELYSPDFDFRTLVTPESMDLINDNLARHLRGEEVQPYDYSIIKKDGKRIEAINASKLIQYGGEAAIIGIVTDITERKRAEQALRESEERLKILFESAPDAIYLVDSEGRFVDGNRTAEDLIGFAKTEVIGKSLAEIGLLSGGQLSRAKDNLKKVATGKLSGPNEYIVKRKDGIHISIEVRTFPVKIGGKMLTLGIARDITEHKRTEKELLEHQAKLKSLASQLSLTEELERHRLATDLHDQISQSLVISKIKLDQLRKSSSSDEINEPLEDISNCLGQIIDDTRTLTFDLSYPILYELGFEAAVAEWLTDQIQEKHEIRTEFEDDGQQKPLDDDIRVLLFRNVRELLINVVKHAQANKVRVSIRKIKDNICISVKDDGVGFDPVEVTSMATKKAEFGLFSIRERLEQLGGLIEIDSKPGRGSKITMTAPLKNEDQADKV